MFSGIVDHCGTIIEIVQRQDALYAQIQTQFDHIQEGESIAVDGICLTALQPQQQTFYCDVSPETMRLTTAKYFAVKRTVNLERALCYGDRVGGHLVSGHIDQCATVESIVEKDGFYLMTFTDIAAECMSYLVKKGSVAINGVSLTVNNVFAAGFDVMLIPHTLERTNLSDLKAAMQINLEFDQLVKTTIHYLKQIELAKK